MPHGKSRDAYIGQHVSGHNGGDDGNRVSEPSGKERGSPAYEGVKLHKDSPASTRPAATRKAWISARLTLSTHQTSAECGINTPCHLLLTILGLGMAISSFTQGHTI